MTGAISAELAKLLRHKATWWLVWLYPLAILLVMLITVLVGMSRGPDATPQVQSAAGWVSSAAAFWEAPRNGLVRLLVAGYVAIVFAGEYGWNTWKLIVPHQRRWRLIAAKYLVALGLLLLAFILAAALFTLVNLVEDLLSGDPVPAGITAGALLGAHGRGLLLALPTLLVTIGYASVAAMLLRSTIGALIAVIVMIGVEGAVTNLAPLSPFAPKLMWGLFHLFPGYHLANLLEWATEGQALRRPFISGGIVALPLATSLAAVAAWVGGLVALTFWHFRRQDIN